ncbi:hypothetical protein KDW_58660 [Dictyobacter vulcani]|uniref:Thioesterase domain-containing protein n=1 Tax=Dictyobacter vulcani TaxID=2607529 RepID=A0A5J4KQQ8_9CHLR|nr:thioesterase domain-containing protein [Dictyobacter vulcani]GER91704.1 hypothetical protein KDW_58660 [Dictyobacter vulcani]
MVAFEIARQLMRKGESVALLALLDSSLPPACQAEAGSCNAVVEQIDDQMVASILREEGALQISDEDLQRSSPQEQLTLAWKQARQTNLLPADTGFEQFKRIAYINCRNLLAVKQYQPAVYSGPMAFFRSSEVLELFAGQPNALTGGWERLCQAEITTHVVPGKHSEMVDEPYVRELARLLSLELSTQSQSVQIV